MATQPSSSHPLYLDSFEEICAELVRMQARCSCSCHFWPHASHGSDCCAYSGMERTATGFRPWPADEDDLDEDEDTDPDGVGYSGPWWSS